MTQEQLIIGNAIIADFLDLPIILRRDITLFKVPDDLIHCDEDYRELELDEFWFNDDWNWFMYAWQEYLRKVAVPIIRDNPKLRYIRPILQKTKKAIVWGHIDTAYVCLIELIKTYNNLFNEC